MADLFGSWRTSLGHGGPVWVMADLFGHGGHVWVMADLFGSWRTCLGHGRHV